MKFLCVGILIFSGFMETMSENFKVVGPAAPLVAEAGEDLVLPCSLQPNISAEDMMVEWIRADLTDTVNLVHLYEDHADRYYDQIKSYRGRTALFKEELQKGNTSLKLSVVQTSDEGVYKCLVKSASWYDDTTVDLVQVKVRLQVVGPAEPLVVEAGEDLVLPCSLIPSISAEAMMVEWIRTDLTEIDSLVHLYEDRADRYYDQMVSYRGRTALFKAELQKGNTSLKLSAVQPSDEGAYKCIIRYRSSFDDIPLYVEVKEQSFHAWKIAIVCFFVFAVILGALSAYILKDARSEKERSPAQCSAVAYMRLKSQYVREELDLKKYNTSEEGYRRLIPAMTNCRKAKFAGCNLSVQSIKTLSAALQTENSSLKELDVSNNKLQDSGVELLSAGLKSSHCKLEILRLALCRFGGKSCENLGSVLQTETSSLKELDISNNELHDSGVELLSAGMKSSHCKLEILRLALCRFGGKSCENLGSVLQTETSSLKELDISNNELHDSGVELLSAGLKSSHCKLEILRLALCRFGGKSCENLGSVLQTETSSLKELDISNNELHDSGVELLSAGLKSSHCKLETLRLSGCMVREEGCSSLASALSSNPSYLKELDLSYNLPGKSGVKLLSARQQDPHCSLKTLRVEHQGEMRIRPKKCKYKHTTLTIYGAILGKIH
ncbi:uncharacterized protein LOC118800403 [Colossoma macropomum]|uniref:uncharacterized protein LOC118800403 n=1 Tax=Colossoma macropomum TaxID=42526 RepID=UPI0018649F80|nr:uncharacterized protein LOC118800403 [Colossoma macropomum]XP_036416506.1 uncharacterized protein LOC118800403 [Colossoma macropomum]